MLSGSFISSICSVTIFYLFNSSFLFKDAFEFQLQKITAESTSKVEAVLKRSEEQDQMIESLHGSVSLSHVTLFIFTQGKEYMANCSTFNIKTSMVKSFLLLV